MENDSNAISDLYFTQDELAGRTGAPISSAVDRGVSSGTVSPEEAQYYRSKAQLSSNLRVLVRIGIFVLPIALTIMVALYVVYLQSVVAPVNQLEVKTDTNKKDIQDLKMEFQNYRESQVQSPPVKTAQ